MFHVNQRILIVTPDATTHPARISSIKIKEWLVGVRRDSLIRVDGSKSRAIHKYIANRYGDEEMFVYNPHLRLYVSVKNTEEYLHVQASPF